MKARWVMVLMVAWVASVAAQMRPRKHDMRRPGLTRSGFLPPGPKMRDGKVIPTGGQAAIKEVKVEDLPPAEPEKKLTLGDIKGAPRQIGKPLRGHYYHYFDVEGVTWHQAKAKCEELGGHLVTIDSKEENSKVYNSFQDPELTNRAWIGACAEGGRWSWVRSAEMWRYSRWVDGEKMSRNDVKRILKAQAEAREIRLQAEAKRAEWVAEAKAKMQKYVERAQGHGDSEKRVAKAVEKGQKLIERANEKADRVELDARDLAACKVVEAAGLRYEGPVTPDEARVAAMEALAATTDVKFLNRSLGNYAYMVRDRWNARFADGGWLKEGEPGDWPITGFVCEWDDKGDIKFAEGADGPGSRRPELTPEQRERVAQTRARVAAERARVSPSGKYVVEVTNGKSGKSKTFRGVPGESAHDAKMKVWRRIQKNLCRAQRKRYVDMGHYEFEVAFLE